MASVEVFLPVIQGPPPFVHRGAWQPGAYLARDSVGHLGSTWFAERDTVEAPGLGSADWSILLDGTSAQANRAAAEIAAQDALSARAEILPKAAQVEADRRAAETASALGQAAAANAGAAAGAVATNAVIVLDAAATTLQAQSAAETARDQAQGAVASGRVRKASLSLLYAVAASYPDGAVGMVDQDGINNGEYVKDSGIWLKTSNATLPALGVLADANQITVGELLSTINVGNSGVAGGASAINVGTIMQGATVPAGSAGTNTYFAPRAPITADQIARFVGCTIYMVAVYDATANLLAERPQLASAAAQVRRGNSTIDTGVVERLYQSGTKITKIVSFVLGSTDTGAGVKWQFGSPVSSANTHTVQLSSLSWYPVVPGVRKATSPADDVMDARISLGAGALARSARSGIGPIWDEEAPGMQVFNGATVRQVAGRNMGFNIPIGFSGQTSYIQLRVAIDANDAAYLTGRTLYVKVGFATSDNLSKTLTPAWGSHTFTVLSNKQVSTNRRVVELVGTLLGTEARLDPYFQITSSSLSTQADYLDLTDVQMDITETTSDVMTSGAESARLAWHRFRNFARADAAALLPTLSVPAYAATVTVAADGSGQYTTIPAALAATTDASASKRYEIVVLPGTYGEVEWTTIRWADLRAIDKKNTILDCRQPDNSTLTTISTNSALEAEAFVTLRNFTILAANARYGIHADAANVPTSRNSFMNFIDCDIRHLGNDGARAYQEANAGNPGGVWSNEVAIGFGLSDGQETLIRGCTLQAPKAGLSMHTRGNYAKPTRFVMEGCVTIATNGDVDGTGPYGTAYQSGKGLSLQALGTGQDDLVRLIGNTFGGPIQVTFGPWYPTALADQVADRFEFVIEGYGNNAVPWLVENPGTRALRIDSADGTDASSVDVTGSAVAVLFGSVVTYRAGGGLRAGVWGTSDVSGIGTGSANNVFITSMGQRLGDCTSVNKTLSVSFQGGAPVVITFSQNYTAVSNTTILAAINATLGAAGTASLFNATSLNRPAFSDEWRSLQNTGATAIRLNQGACYDANERAVRLMTSADAAADFAGVALEDIRPGEWGRVKYRGAERISYGIDRSDSGTFVRGDTFGIGSTPGRFVKGASIPLLRAYNTQDVRWG